MNDIIFFLLLFFLLTSTFGVPSVIKVLLPKAKGETNVVKKTVTLIITEDLRYFLNNKPITFEQLEPTLVAEMANIPEPTVVLDTDRNIKVQNLVDVLEIANRHKIKMVLSTKVDDNG
jgi:biopolymer transport protein ExbD